MQINYHSTNGIKKFNLGLFGNNAWIVLVISAVSVLPLFLSQYPPCVDIPQHAGQIELYKEMHSQSFPYRSLFKIHLMTPYLLGYFIVYMLSMIVSISWAIKITLAGAMMATPVMTGKVLKAIGSNELLALLVIPSIYGFSFNWGFLNFIVAIPVGIMLLGGLIRKNQVQSRYDKIKVALLINFLFFCHALVWAFFFGISILILLFQERSAKKFLSRVLPFLSSLPVVFLWFFYITKNNHSIISSKINFSMGVWRLNPLPLIFGTNTFSLYMGLFAGILCLPVMVGGRFSKDWARYIPVMASLFVVSVFPHSFLDIAFIYERFTPFIVPFYLFVFDFRLNGAPVRSKIFAWVAIYGLVLVFVLNQAIIMSLFNQESSRYTDIQNKMKEGKRVLMLMYMRDSEYSVARVYLHFPLW
ncbi:MAG: hypothetical protein HKM02_05445 [Pseudomonadales bacterium]|nr:hypothetical protein [Pseudomonadales bacterium]